MPYFWTKNEFLTTTVRTLFDEDISKQFCECTDNVNKEKYVCNIFAVLINLYMNSQLNGFHELMVFTIIILMNNWEIVLERKIFSKSAP